jgi:hypothetical protein
MEELATCIEYSACQALLDYVGPQGEVEKAAFDLEQACSDDLLSTQEGRIECIRGCYPGLCCVDPLDSCFKSNIFTCPSYFSCEKVVDSDNGGFDGIVPLLNVSKVSNDRISLPSLELAEICEIEALLDSRNITECFGMCSAASCCTSAGNNCYAANGRTCDLYAACFNLLFLPFSEDESGNGTSAFPSPSEYLEIFC